MILQIYVTAEMFLQPCISTFTFIEFNKIVYLFIVSDIFLFLNIIYLFNHHGYKLGCK